MTWEALKYQFRLLHLPYRLVESYTQTHLLMVIQGIRNHIAVQADLLSWYVSHLGHLIGSGGILSHNSTNILVDFNRPITWMTNVAAIRINSAIIIGILSLPFKIRKNHMLRAKVWSKLPNATGKYSNLNCFILEYLQVIGFMLYWSKYVTVKRWFE